MSEFDFQRVRDILVCPLTHAKLVMHGQTLVSTDAKTRLSYEIQEGIPRLLVDSATELSAEEWQSIMDAQESSVSS